MNSNDLQRIQHIKGYCEDISSAIKRFGNNKETFLSDKDFRNSLSMSILQIGELTTHLTDAFKTAHNDVPWRDIRAMRNIAAHKYGTLDLIILHNTIQDRIPELRKYCEQIISQNQILEQDALTVQEPEMTM